MNNPQRQLGVGLQQPFCSSGGAEYYSYKNIFSSTLQAGYPLFPKTLLSPFRALNQLVSYTPRFHRGLFIFSHCVAQKINPLTNIQVSLNL